METAAEVAVAAAAAAAVFESQAFGSASFCSRVSTARPYRLSWRIVSSGWSCQPLARKQKLRAVAAPRCWSEQPFIRGHFEFTQCSFHLR